MRRQEKRNGGKGEEIKWKGKMATGTLTLRMKHASDVSKFCTKACNPTCAFTGCRGTCTPVITATPLRYAVCKVFTLLTRVTLGTRHPLHHRDLVHGGSL